LNPLAVTAEPLLRAIADHPRQANTALASVSGRSDKNLPRDLKSLEAAGLIALKPTEITEAACEQLAMLDRAAR
jgi:predicted transcriptional regulator